MITSSEDGVSAIGLAFVDAFNRRDADALIATCDAGIEWQPTVLVGARRTYRGHEGLRCWVEDLAASPVQHRSAVRGIRLLEDSRFVIFADLDTGDGATTPAAMVAQLGAGGLIVEGRGYLSDERLLGQLGVLG